MKKLLALALCLTLLPLPVRRVHADDSDIFGANIQPNIMIFIDDSGSMSDQIYDNPYNPSLTYTGTYTLTVVYKATTGQHQQVTYSLYANSVSAVNSTSAQSGLNGVGYWSGKIAKSNVTLDLGNYLNWQGTSGATLEQKIVIAKRVLTNLINNTEGVRFGLATFTGNTYMGQGGARILAPIGSSNTTLINALNGLNPGGYTPLGEALRDLGGYFDGTMGGQASPIQYPCQPNFIIMMTDGEQNGSVDVRAVATSLYTQGLPGIQNIISSYIGFAVSPNEQGVADATLQTAAQNGGGQFYTADTVTQLEQSLQAAIQQIVAATFTFATPTIPTTNTTGVSRAYLAAVQSNPSRPFWRGYLKAYQRDPTTGQVPVDSNGIPLDSALQWEAGQMLTQQAASDRTITTVIGGTQQPFTTDNTTLTPALLGVSSSTDRSNVIGFIRGVDTTDENGNGNVTEDRQWKLGDIFHSTPVVVSPPFLPVSDASYAAFRATNASRTTVVIVGANDGMLHAFKETNGATPAEDGKELWAFIPPDQLSRLSGLLPASGEHLFFVDGAPVAADVKIGGSWRTILIFGERRGGSYYHALDITDTTNPQYLWGFTDSKMGETWSTPVIGKVKMADGTDRWVAFFGGGYWTAQNNLLGKAVFAVDMATGAKLWEYYNAAGSTDDRKYMNFSVAADPLALDLDKDGYTDRLYIGDIGGQLWKFDLSAPAHLTSGLVDNWAGKRLFAAAPTQANPPTSGEYYPTQAIYAAPDAASDRQNNLWIYVGTGDRNHPNNTAANRFYGIQDSTDMTNGSALTESSLVDVTSSDTAASQGWYVRLGGTNEKILAAADVFNWIVYFSSFTPTTSTVCGSGGGTAKLYAIQMATGFAAIDWSTSLAYATGGSSSSNARAKTIGTGIPSRPIIIITDAGTALTTMAVAATTSQQLPSNPAPPPSFMRHVLYWREVF